MSHTKVSRLACGLCTCMIAGLLCSLMGCRNSTAHGPTVPVTGKVTLGGKPLVGGTVSFVPLDQDYKGPLPTAEVDSSGSYSAVTDGQEGAPPGKYRATVTISGDDRTQNTLFNPVYSNMEKSPLVVEVREGAPPGAYELKMLPRQ